MAAQIADVCSHRLERPCEHALGLDDEPDLLVVSFSTTDYVGHNFGPDSLEQLDTLRRADVAVRRLLSELHKRVGRREVVVALSSDHGSSPPLAKTTSRATNGILSIASLTAAAEAATAAALPKEKKKRMLGIIMPERIVTAWRGRAGPARAGGGVDGDSTSCDGPAGWFQKAD